ncbi:MAG TPA: GH1 family beta-glucosidase [Acidimicrobiia bacterium]|nr:GH1 family beta-glucosidase [Acidimicrobiia bacterium]
MTSVSQFPPGFLWGVATASYQIEGAVDADGRGKTIWDTFAHTPGMTSNGDNGDVAVDHYHRYVEDVALMSEIGVNAYRFSIAWSRLLPEGTGRVNQAGIDFYRRLCKELSGAGITPVATLYHWDLPQSLQERGGWVSPESVAWFTEYAAVAKDALGDMITTWATLNEPWCTAFLGHSAGEHAPGITETPSSFLVAHHLMLAHHSAIGVMRETSPRDEDKLGIVLNLIPAWPQSDTEDDRAAAEAVDLAQNRLFTDAVFHGTYSDEARALHEHYGVADHIDVEALVESRQPIDFLGVNYYNINHIEHSPGAESMPAWPGTWDSRMARPPGELTEMNWGVEPEGLTWMLERVAREHPGTPILICENGAAYVDQVGPDGYVDDLARTDYVKRHIEAMKTAIDRGVDVRGYFLWSLLDNFEWARGYEKRFGIVRVDLDTMVRTPKRSGLWYRDFLAGSASTD